MFKTNLHNLLKRFLLFFEIPIRLENKKYNKSIIVSYLTMPFRMKHKISYLNQHQNRRETLAMADVLESLGFNCTFIRFNSFWLPQNKCDIIFGLEPNFIKLCKKKNTAKKIYYATGAYYEHQNYIIKRRTDEFNRTHKCNVPYYRLVKPHESVNISDAIIQIGSKYTLQTYPEIFRNKIHIIRQSCHSFSFPNFIEKKSNQFSKKDYIWIGSEGSILKGLDIVIDCFLNHPEINLHIVGIIDSELKEYYSSIIKETPNIHFYGYLDMDSEIIENICLKSTFVIMPSGSEGVPGAVINMMKLGCIPIVSKYAAFNEIENYGYLMNDLTINSLDEIIIKTKSLKDQELAIMIRKVYDFSNKEFNIQTFKDDFKRVIQEISLQ